MKHDEHSFEGIFRDHYMSNNDIDDQNSYLERELRSIVIDLFREMTLSRNLDL